MKKPERKLNMNYGEDIGYITGWNRALEISEKYHKQNIKENYIKKPSVEKIEKVIYAQGGLCSGYARVLANAIIKELGGK